MGPVASSVAADEYQSFSCSVFRSSATTALAMPSPVALPAPTVASSVPSVVNATAPTMAPPLLFHETTGLASLSRSIAHTPAAAPPHSADVAAYSVVSMAMGDVHVELAGRN